MIRLLLKLRKVFGCFPLAMYHRQHDIQPKQVVQKLYTRPTASASKNQFLPGGQKSIHPVLLIHDKHLPLQKKPHHLPKNMALHHHIARYHFTIIKYPSSRKRIAKFIYPSATGTGIFKLIFIIVSQ